MKEIQHMKKLKSFFWLRKYRRLKATAKYYEIEYTDSLFGSFGGTFKELNTNIVLARSPFEAVKRLRKRGISTRLSYSDSISIEMWARYKVRLLNKSNTHRHITYLK